jgi:RNA polymerase sigma-70 factor (ECF subfamily)
MHNEDHERELVIKAVKGDQASLQKLLVSQTDVIVRYAHRKLPRTAQEQVDPEDIVQQTFVKAFRSIGRFRIEDAKGFQGWLLAIADHVIKDAIKGQQRIKRGGQFQRLRHAEPTPSCSVADLVELLSAGINSPSYSVMGHEAVTAVQKVIADLPDDYRQAVQSRLLEGKSLDETAELMNRTPRAVQGLVDRAKKRMRAALETLSNYR